MPAYAGARAWRRLIAPGWSPALSILADLIGAIAGIIVLSEVLGSIGWFRRGPMIVGAVALGLGLGVVVLAPDRGPSPPAPSHHRRRVPRPHRRTEVIVASASTALVAAQWSTWVSRGLSAGVGNSGGPGNGDSLWYHMPFAAAFVQSGWTSRLQYLNGEALVTYYPANTSVLHAVGLMTMGSDVAVAVHQPRAGTRRAARRLVHRRARGVGPVEPGRRRGRVHDPGRRGIRSRDRQGRLLGIVGLLACIAFVVHSGSVGRPEPCADHVARSTPAWPPASRSAASSRSSRRCWRWRCASPSSPRRALGISTMTRWAVAAFATGGYWYCATSSRSAIPCPASASASADVHLPRPPTPSMDDFGTNLLHNLANGRVWHEAAAPRTAHGLRRRRGRSSCSIAAGRDHRSVS